MTELQLAEKILLIFPGLCGVIYDVVRKWKKSPQCAASAQRILWIIQTIIAEYDRSLALVGIMFIIAGFLTEKYNGILLIVIGMYLILNDLRERIKEFRRQSQENNGKKRMRRVISFILDLIVAFDLFLGLGVILIFLGFLRVFP